MATETTTLDVVTAAILRAKLDAVVTDMATTLRNVARSDRISGARAFACGVLDVDGELVAADNALHLSTLVDSARSCLDYYQFSIAADDVIITNDPYSGGSTLHYLTAVAPLASGDDIVAYLVVQAHMIDLGGVIMGNYHAAATELWAEAVRFTPLKVVIDGKVRRDAMDTLTLNSRDREGFRGDIDAIVATVNIGRRRLRELIHDYGLPDVVGAMSSSVDYSERRFRAELDAVPDGTYTGEATLDHDGQGATDLTVRVTMRKDADGLRLDFGETDDQSTGFVNSTPSNTRCYALLPLLGLLDESVPVNSGLLHPVEVVTRKGTLVHSAFPAPTGWSREHVGYEIAEAVGHALLQALEDNAGLGYASRNLVLAITKDVRTGDVEEQLAIADLGAIGQAGDAARAGADGWGQAGPASRGTLPSVEEFEAESGDVAVAQMELREDSAGPGRWRGAPATETVIRYPAGTLDHLYACLVAATHAMSGHAGGSAGGPASATLALGDGDAGDVPPVMLDQPLGEGAELTLRAAGGGGWGPAVERSVDRVANDVRNGYVSVDAALGAYGVVIDPETFAVDEEGTRRARESGEAAARVGDEGGAG